jgi:hypothetical protein
MWGKNDHGQLGLGDLVDRDEFVEVKVLGKNGFKDVALAANSTVFLTLDGSTHAQTSEGYIYQVENSKEFLSVTAGYATFIGVCADSTAWAWGENSYNQFGNGGTQAALATEPVRVGEAIDLRVRKAVTGFNFSIAIATDGTLWTCGNNIYAQLGDGTRADTNKNWQQIGTDTDWIDIFAGSFTSYGIALKMDGSVYVWGHNYGSTFGSRGNSATINGTSQRVIMTPTLLFSASDALFTKIHDLYGIGIDGGVYRLEGELNSVPVRVSLTGEEYIDIAASRGTYGVPEKRKLFAIRADTKHLYSYNDSSDVWSSVLEKRCKSVRVSRQWGSTTALPFCGAITE